MKTMQVIQIVGLLVMCSSFSFNEASLIQFQDYTGYTIIKNVTVKYVVLSNQYWTLHGLDFIFFVGAAIGTITLSVLGGIRAVLVMSCCFSAGVIIFAFEPLTEVLNSNDVSSDGMVNLFSILKDIASSSSLIEVQKQNVIIECVASILLCLIQISLSIIILSEENHVQIWRKTWLILQIPATFFTLYTVIISNKCWMNNYNIEYERFRRSVLSYLIFIYFALPSLVFLETDKKLITYRAPQEFRV